MRSDFAFVIYLLTLVPIGSLEARSDSFSAIEGTIYGHRPPAELTARSGATRRDVVCLGERAPEHSAAVPGRAIDADEDRQLARAEVQAMWMGCRADRSARRSAAPTSPAATGLGANGYP
jgi:hypothetical protein